MKDMGTPGRLARYFDNYAAFHQTRGNRVCHSFGIPLILFSILGGLSRVVLPNLPSFEVALDLGILAWGLSLSWYLVLDWRLALPYALSSFGLYVLGKASPVELLGAAFVLGWILQLVGHSRYEKNSPAFLTNVLHLLIGPFWVFAKLIGYAR